MKRLFLITGAILLAYVLIQWFEGYDCRIAIPNSLDADRTLMTLDDSVQAARWMIEECGEQATLNWWQR